MTTLERAARYLAKMPEAISGQHGHDATFRAACAAVHGFALNREDALALLRRWNQTHCKPKWSDSALVHKIDSALAKSPDKPRGYLLGDHAGKSPAAAGAASPESWPDVDVEAVRRIASTGASLADLFELSPIRPEGMTAEEYVDALFAGDPFLCIGEDQRRAITARREALRGQLSKAQFIVPNPMTSLTGKALHGGDSARCLDNTGPRRFLVIECDFTPETACGYPPPDVCAAVLIELARLAPLVLAVHSGGKSVHGWFYCQDQPEDRLRRFMRYAVTIGADRATWTRCQFVRMPEGRRATGERQAVHYFNPNPLQQS